MKQSVVVALSVVLFLLLTPGQQCNPSVAPVCGRHSDLEGYIFINRHAYVEDESLYGDFPWMVAVMKKEQTSNRTLKVYHCGGSLIHPKVVLTAAHSVDNLSPAQLMIRAGEWDSSDEEELFPHQERNVIEVVSHPEYHKEGLWNDVALLFLDSPVTLQEGIRTICLPPPEATFDRQRCFVTGWQKEKFGLVGRPWPAILRKAELVMIPANECQSTLRNTRLGSQFDLHSSFVCAVAGDNLRETCWGDGGAPMVCPVEGSDQQFYQVGIAAWGMGCDKKDIQGVYANVALARNWIDQEMQKRFLDTSSYTPQKIRTTS